MFIEPLLTLEAVTLASLLEEYRAGRDPIVDREAVVRILPALGRPIPHTHVVRDLNVATWTLGGRSVAPLSRFLEAADAYIARRADKPNRKAAAIAKARSAKIAKAASA